MSPDSSVGALNAHPLNLAAESRWFKGARTGLWYTALLAVPIIFVVFPLVVMLVNGFTVPGQGTFTLKYMAELLSNQRYLRPLYNTLFISFVTTGVTMTLGIPLAFYLWMREFPGKRLLLNLLVIPYMMPVYIIALSLILLAGKNGVLAGLIARMTANPDYRLPFEIMFSLHGIVSVYVFHNIALVVFLVMAYLSGVDRGLVEAARSLGANPFTAVRRVIFSLAKPAITGAAMLVFARTMVDYVVIDTIGGFRFATLAVEIYNLNFGFMEQELAAPLSALLAVMTMGIMYTYLYLFRWRNLG